MLPDFSLNINGTLQAISRPTHVRLPDDIADTQGDRYMVKLKEYAMSIPYAIEPYAKAVELLDFYLLRLTQCVEAKDFDIGFLQWDSMIT